MAQPPAVVGDIEMYSEECPECGQIISHIHARVAKMLLGKHRRQAHGVEGTGHSSKRSRPRSGRPPVREEQPAAVRVAKAIADELPDKKTPPGAADLTKALGKGLGTISTLAASWAAETDPTVSSEQDLDAITDYLSLSPEGAKEIAYPFAKYFAKSKLNKRYGQSLVENIDVISAAAELFDYGRRWRRYMTERRRREEARTTRAPQGPVTGDVSGPIAATPVHFPTPGTGEMATGMVGVPATNGHVVDASEVRRMRGGMS